MDNMNSNKSYICIDLKSFFASVECVERKLNPLDVNLVVADSERTDKTICLAVTPPLKSFGVSGRPRLFEAKKKVDDINKNRLKNSTNNKFIKESYYYHELLNDRDCKLSFIVARPRMGLYVKYSSFIYSIYLRYIAKEDIHVYSIDEVFIDATPYLKTYNKTAEQLALTLIKDVLKETGITATAGVGTNMYLAKVAMDIVAKKMEPDEDGVRIASLDEIEFRRQLWNHLPITDFWRIGNGLAKRLNDVGIHTMGELALVSLKEEDLLFRLFGVNAELMIDHAWGYEPTTIKDIKNYKSKSNQTGIGQVLHKPYPYDKALVIVKEMADELVSRLIKRGLVTKNLFLHISYDISNAQNPSLMAKIDSVVYDYYGRLCPVPAMSRCSLFEYSSSTDLIVNSFCEMFKRSVNSLLTIRRINVACDIYKKDIKPKVTYIQPNLFTNVEKLDKEYSKRKEKERKESIAQKTILDIKQRFGKNAVIKGIDLTEDATQIDRNKQIGGHKE